MFAGLITGLVTFNSFCVYFVLLLFFVISVANYFLNREIVSLNISLTRNNFHAAL